MREIVQDGDPVLRKIAAEVPLSEIQTPKIQNLIREMKEAVSQCEDGVALAAPQIGESLRIFVVDPRAFHEEDDISKEPLVYINPVITKMSKEKVSQDEGCLSVRWIYGQIDRAEKATVTAYNEQGKKFTRGASGLLAEIFQHEVDHLNGILFKDTATNLRTIPPKGAKESAASHGHNHANPKFVFFGTPTFAVTVLDELEAKGFKPALVVTAPDKPVGKKKVVTAPPVKLWAQKRGLPVLQPVNLKADEASKALAAIAAELFIVAAYGKIIPQSVLDIPPHGSLNVHPSLLPRHRGASPLQSTILAGDTQTGVTIMLMDAEMDHGPIVASESIDLPDGATYEKLETLMARIGGELLADIIPDWLDGSIEAVEQEHDKATFTKKISTEDGLLDLSKPEEADRKVRALNPNPGTYLMLEKESKPFRVKVLSGKIDGENYLPDRVIPEGRKGTNWREFLKTFE